MNFSQEWAQLVWGLMGYDPKKNPKAAQAIYALLDGIRYLLLCGGERAGKSATTVALCLLLMEPGLLKKGLGWLIGPDYNQARAEFEYFYNVLNKGGMIKKVSMPQSLTAPWTLETTWDFTLSTKTASDLRKIASFAPNFVALVEAAQQPYESLLKARGRVMEKRGHVILSGTLEDGLPWYGDLLRRWKGPNVEGGEAFSIPTWSNLAIFPKGWEDETIQAEYKFHEARNSLEYFWERYGAEPQKATGLVIPEFDFSRHVRELRADPDVPVELWMDPGKNAYAVLFVQIIGETTYVLDRVYKRDALVDDVIPDVLANPLFELVKKNKGSHGIIDIAGKHEYGMPSHVQIWREKAGINLRSKYVHQKDSREVVRYRLRDNPKTGEPQLLLNSHFTNAKNYDGTANDVLAEFELWKWRQTGPNSSEPAEPINANNHAIKALGYGLFSHFGPADERKASVIELQRDFWHTL